MVKPKTWKLLFSKRAQQDAKRLKKSNLKTKTELLLDVLEDDPFQSPPPFKKLTGDFINYYSRRINIQHRLVYSVDSSKKEIKIVSMWHHYND